MKSVAELRKHVADNFTQNMYNAYKELELIRDSNIQSLQEDLERKNTEINKLKSDITQVSQTETKTEIQDKIKKVSQEKSDIFRELNDAITQKNDNLSNDTLPYKMISKFTSLTMFKEEIKKSQSSYWADQNAFNILEKVLNVKFIILENIPIRGTDTLSSDNKSQVTITCSKNDLFRPDEMFNPEYYIIINFMGFGHYELIKYKSNGMFTFTQLPDTVKNKIVNKCIEDINKNNTAFHNIPDFRKYVEEQIKINPPTPHDIPEGSTNSPNSSQDALNSCIDGLCDDTVIFTFYHTSADKPPGKGNNERIPPSKESEYKDLKKLKNWRKILSDNYKDPNMIISVNGVTYESIQEFVKSKKKDKGTYQDALLSKFRDNDALYFKEILIATKNAKLLQHVHRNEPIFAKDLMLLRNKLQDKIFS